MAQPERLISPPEAAELTSEEVFQRYHDMVYRLAASRTGSRHHADDVLQEVFLRYIRSRPVFLEEEHRKAWLLRVTVNCCNSLMGSAWLRRTVPLEERFAIRLKEHSELWDAVMRLSPTYRTVIHLFYFEDCSIAEIAKILDLSESAVKVRLHRARGKLRNLLEGVSNDV